MLFMFDAIAQYSCPTATFIEVKDSCELETYYHSGYDDRWFTFTPETPGVGFQIEWDYTPRWAYIPYDTLYVYTGSCDSLVEYAVFSPIPTAGQAIFDGNSDVYLRFTRDHNTPQNIEFDLCLFGILECVCEPEITIDETDICIGECVIIENTSFYCNQQSKEFELTVSPACSITDATTGTSVFAGTISGDYFSDPNFVVIGRYLEVCPVTTGLHTIHAHWFGGDNPGDMIDCSAEVEFYVHDVHFDDYTVTGEPCSLLSTIINNKPGYEIPCCVESINYSLDVLHPNIINSITWIFHENADLNNSNYQVYLNSSISGQTPIFQIIDELSLNCNDIFYISVIVEHVCGEDLITKAFVLKPPVLDFTATTVCLGDPTDFYPAIDTDCVDAWLWDFGDGYILTSASPLQDVSHLYTAPGDYPVSLTIYYYDNHCSVTVNHSVSVFLIEKPEFSIPWEWACADEIVFTIENYDPSLQYFYTIDDPFATYEPLPLLGASSPLPQVEIPWPGMTGGIIYIHVLDDYGCYAYDSLMVFNCCIDPLSGDFFYNNTFSGNQTINGQSFYMNGTIDFAPLSNYQFIDCNFYFSPNTKMIIPDFVNVSINKSGSLQACDPLMWDGVYIYGSGFLTIAGGSPTNVLIQDAKHAVVSENGGRYAIKNATFDKNYNHLSVYSQPCAAHTGEIHTSELICSDIILPQYPPVFAQRTRFAIDIRGIRSITIGKAGPANRKNTIENCDVGIYSWNSMVNVSNNHFKEINVPFMSSVIQGMPSHPRGYAIYSYAGPMAMPDCGGAPMYQRGLITSNIGMLKTNVFTNCTRGIFLHDNQIANIIRNDFINGPNVNGYAAIEFSSFFYQGQKNVSVNKIEGYRFGITATNTNNMVVNGNVIEKLNLPPWLFGTQVSAGIEIKGGANNIINANTVNNSAKPQHFRYEGIKVVQSASSLTMCNTLRSLGKAIRYSGTCVPAEIKLNKMHNSTLGFCLSDNGYTGQQGIMGQPWDNTWHGTFTHHLYTMNNTFGNLLENHWYISNQTGPKKPLGFNSLYDLTGTPVYVYTTSGMLFPGLCAVPLLSFQISYQPLLDDIALDQVPALQNPQHRRWMSRDGLMKTIDANPHLLQSPVLQNFRTAQQFESTGQLEIVLDTVSKGYITEGRMLNDAIQPVSEPDSLARAVHQIMLNADLINTQFFADAFDTTAVAQLQQFAQLCPFVHGNYVFVCRVLLQMTGDTTEYWHVCEEDADFIPGKAMPIADEISQLKIYPNPANDFVTVETDMPLPATMYLYNTMGQKIDEIQIIDTVTVLDVSKYRQQLIFYYINGKSGKISLMQ
jgi:PKD repeat protein